MSRQLDEQVAIVTGGARGIGRAIAERFAEAGASVCVADRDGASADLLAETLSATGAQAIGVAVDISDRAQIDLMMDVVAERLGPRGCPVARRT